MVPFEGLEAARCPDARSAASKPPSPPSRQSGNHGPEAGSIRQSTTAATRQIRLLHASKNLQQVRGLGVLHGRLISVTVCNQSQMRDFGCRATVRFNQEPI